jgi:hypothetical protein
MVRPVGNSSNWRIRRESCRIREGEVRKNHKAAFGFEMADLFHFVFACLSFRWRTRERRRRFVVRRDDANGVTVTS